MDRFTNVKLFKIMRTSVVLMVLFDVLYTSNGEKFISVKHPSKSSVLQSARKICLDQNEINNEDSPVEKCIKDLCLSRPYEIYDEQGCQLTCKKHRLHKMTIPDKKFYGIKGRILNNIKLAETSGWRFRVPAGLLIGHTSTETPKNQCRFIDIPDCICKPGFLRNGKGWCVREIDCDFNKAGEEVSTVASKHAEMVSRKTIVEVKEDDSDKLDGSRDALNEDIQLQERMEEDDDDGDKEIADMNFETSDI